MKYDILNLSKIFEDFIDKHKEIDEIGRGMWYDEEPERDLDIRYDGQNYVLTIRKMKE